MGFLRRRAASEPAAPGGDRWLHLPDPPMSEELKREQSGDIPEHGLVRPVWTERDFPALGWHDASVWAFEIQHGEYFDEESQFVPTGRVVLDLDYITRWVHPRKSREPFTFWVAPCTLVFSGVTELELDLKTAGTGPHEIDDIHPVQDGWHVAGHEFDMKLAATGFRQTFRQRPVHTDGQTLGLTARGGYSYNDEPTTL